MDSLDLLGRSDLRRQSTRRHINGSVCWSRCGDVDIVLCGRSGNAGSVPGADEDVGCLEYAVAAVAAVAAVDDI